ncbi:hypothetical protein LP52_03775 [Streptomonospora alba]|uniref:Lipoprotein n=1 Tax=Streptomonospora alba TaxID=183763 RepID=A0A0C2JM81_9ACTN|nr:hypothetical protein [Streptomonospora alba]KII00061.1 hypothetical protein LP52_03775 [Streptomonospora alba]
MRSAVHTAAATAAVLAVVASAAGCSDEGGGGAPSSTSTPTTQEPGGGDRPSPEQASEGGMNGVWESTLDESGIETLIVLGEDVRTEGDVACPGTLDPAESGSTATVELDCETAAESRSGTAELNAEDDHLVLSWNESDGFPEAFARTDEDPVIQD